MRAIIDASVVIAALAPDEALDSAIQTIEPFFLGGGHVPAIWPFEIANALYWKVRRGGLLRAAAEQVLHSAFRIPLVLDYRTPADIEQHVDTLSWKHGLTTYDAAYLELSLRLVMPLASIDKALIRAARAEGVTVL